MSKKPPTIRYILAVMARVVVACGLLYVGAVLLAAMLLAALS